MWEVNGLPLHALVVHAAVVFGPVSALVALAYAVLPGWRDRLRWVTVGLVVIAFATIWAAYLSGENFLENGRQFANLRGEAKDRIERHEELADTLRWLTTGFVVVTVLAIWQHARAGAVRSRRPTSGASVRAAASAGSPSTASERREVSSTRGQSVGTDSTRAPCRRGAGGAVPRIDGAPDGRRGQ